MKKMVIFTSLFFNKYGNQSFLETVKGYSKYYDIIIITSHNDDEYYIDLKEAKNIFGESIIIYRTHTYVKVFYKLAKLLLKKKKNSINVSSSRNLVNDKYTLFSIIYYYITNILKISKFIIEYIKGNLKNLELICAYEIGGVAAAQFAKKFYKKCKLIAKFQGTILYWPIVENRISKISYYLDYDAYKRLKYFDFITMTNDGTKGIEVLKHFEIDERKIIFLPNGITNYLVGYKEKLKNAIIDDERIRLFTISRLIPWKRVDLAIEIANFLSNIYKFNNYLIDIYGYGTDSEIKLLNDKIIKYHLQNNVKLNGAIAYSEVPYVLANHDFLLSLYKHTNVTNPLLEAAYFGVGIISIKSSDLLKILDIENCNNIALFEEKSENELCRSIALYILNICIDNIREENFIIRKSQTIKHRIYTWKDRIKFEYEYINQIPNEKK